MNLIIEPEELECELRQLGFHEVHVAREGGLHLNKACDSPQPFFNGEYFGQVGVYEVMAKKGAP